MLKYGRASLLSDASAMDTKSSLLRDAKHLRSRANEMRCAAEEMRDANSRVLVLQIAADYDLLALLAEAQAALQPRR